jgi:hypothetical protein
MNIFAKNSITEELPLQQRLELQIATRAQSSLDSIRLEVLWADVVLGFLLRGVGRP